MYLAIHTIKDRALAAAKRADDALIRFFERPRPRAVALGILKALRNVRLVYVLPLEKILQTWGSRRVRKG